MNQRAYGIRELANWILDFAEKRGVELTNMSLNKLVYFAYEHSLVAHGIKLTNAKIEAWEHGPVFREVYRSFSEFGNRPITTRAGKFSPATNRVEIVEPKLSAADEKIVEEGISPLFRLPASILRELSHASDGPWAATWYHEDATNPGMQITDDIILRLSRRTLMQ